MQPAGLSLLLRRLAVLGLPLTAVIGTYFFLDPFQVLRPKSSLAAYWAGHHGVSPNREAVCTELLLRQHGQTRYDSFIFGNSRSLAVLGSDWLCWIEPARPFHFDALAESLLGLRGKLRFLEGEGVRIRNALIVLDDSVLARTADTDDPVTIKHPRISSGSMLRFQTVFLKAYLSKLFALKYLDYRVFGVWRPYMTGAIDIRRYDWDPNTNDAILTGLEEEIARDPERYYSAPYWSVARVSSEAPRVVREEQLAMLREIRDLLARRLCRVRIVVPPSFRRIRLNQADVAQLRDLFGPDRVHDFSAQDDLAASVRDWYDTVHFRPVVGREILRRTYSTSAD